MEESQSKKAEDIDPLSQTINLPTKPSEEEEDVLDVTVNVPVLNPNSEITKPNVRLDNMNAAKPKDVRSDIREETKWETKRRHGIELKPKKKWFGRKL